MENALLSSSKIDFDFDKIGLMDLALLSSKTTSTTSVMVWLAGNLMSGDFSDPVDFSDPGDLMAGGDLSDPGDFSVFNTLTGVANPDPIKMELHIISSL